MAELCSTAANYRQEYMNLEKKRERELAAKQHEAHTHTLCSRQVSEMLVDEAQDSCKSIVSLLLCVLFAQCARGRFAIQALNAFRNKW